MKTIEEIESYLRRNGQSGVMAVRIRNMAAEFKDKFGSVDSFFSAKRSDVERVYNGLTPGNKHGIGKAFWTAFKMAKDFYNGLDTDVSPAKEETPRAEDPTVDTREVEMISYEALKKIVDMMEMLEVEAINLMEISGFLRNVRFRQKKPPEANASGQTEDAGVLNAKQA